MDAVLLAGMICFSIGVAEALGLARIQKLFDVFRVVALVLKSELMCVESLSITII